MATPRRVFLALVASLAIATASAMCRVWTFGPRQRRGLGRFQARLDIERLEAHIRIVAAWFGRSRHHPRYTRHEWTRNLEYARRWGLSGAELARDLVVSSATACHRLRLREQDGFDTAYVKPRAPCVRIDDGRRKLVADMAVGGFEHDSAIARHLHGQGEKISARSVGRIRAQAGVPAAPARRAGKLDPAKKTRKPAKPAVETPDASELAASYVVGPLDRPRPRRARLLSTLAEAFAECIARDTLWSMDEELLDTEADLLRRTRLSERLAILLVRLRRIPHHKRPHYTATERAQILTFKNRFRLSNKTLAAWFLLDPNTLSAWNLDVDYPERRPRPLVEPIDDIKTAVASLAAYLPPVPKRLTQSIADTVSALAEKVDVRRRRQRQAAIPPDAADATTRLRKPSPIVACYPNHIWGSDITVIVLDRDFHLAAIIDVFSRDILAWDLFTVPPKTEQIAALFDKAAACFGKPRCFLSDQGSQFKGALLAEALEKLGIDHREGAVGQHGSIAIIERLWRTAKGHLDFIAVRPNVPDMLRERVIVVVDYYRTKRPHSALGNATPAQVYGGHPAPAATAKKAPRGWPGQPCAKAPFVIRYAFAADRKLPYLERVA